MNLGEILKNITKGESPYNTLLATVKSVDESARTCDVLPVDGSAEIFGVRLNPLLETDSNDKGEYNIPAVNSIVLVTLLDSANAFVSGFSVIEKKIGTIGKVVYSITKDNGIDLKVDTNKAIVTIANNGRIDIKSTDNVYFNNGSNGGLAIAPNLRNHLEEVKTAINTIISTFNSHIHPAGTPNTAIPVTLISGSAPNVPNIENGKVRH